MKSRIAWLTLSCLMVAALVLSSCQAATVEEEKEADSIGDDDPQARGELR